MMFLKFTLLAAMAVTTLAANETTQPDYDEDAKQQFINFNAQKEGLRVDDYMTLCAEKKEEDNVITNYEKEIAKYKMDIIGLPAKELAEKQAKKEEEAKMLAEEEAQKLADEREATMIHHWDIHLQHVNFKPEDERKLFEADWVLDLFFNHHRSVKDQGAMLANIETLSKLDFEKRYDWLSGVYTKAFDIIRADLDGVKPWDGKKSAADVQQSQAQIALKNLNSIEKKSTPKSVAEDTGVLRLPESLAALKEYDLDALRQLLDNPKLKSLQMWKGLSLKRLRKKIAQKLELERRRLVSNLEWLCQEILDAQEK